MKPGAPIVSPAQAPLQDGKPDLRMPRSADVISQLDEVILNALHGGRKIVIFVLVIVAAQNVEVVAGEPRMVVARLIGSLLTAVVMGALWLRWGRSDWITRRVPKMHDTNASRWTVFTEAARHDFLTAASYLVLGAAAAAEVSPRGK